MSAIIKTLKTKTDDIEKNVYPKTVLEAVVDPDTGKTLDILLDENMPEGVVYTNDESEPETNVDAVTSASYVSYSNTTSGLEAINVQDAIDEINELKASKTDIDEVNTYLQRGGKNLLKITKTSQDYGGLGTVLTVNEDKSISLSGTQAGTNIQPPLGEAYLKANTEYVLSGCPEGGSISTYSLRVYVGDGSNPKYAYDIGEGITFTVPNDGIYKVITDLIVGTTYDGITYYPMIREATVEDDTYEPYYQDAMTMVNHLNDNALVHGDVVDNLLSNRADLPLSANQGRELSNGINALNSLIKYYYLDGGQTTLRMYLHTGRAAVLFGYYLGNNGIDGSNIFALSLKRSYDSYGGNVVLTYLDGSACNFPVTSVDNNYIDIGFSSVSIYGYIHFTALYL